MVCVYSGIAVVEEREEANGGRLQLHAYAAASSVPHTNQQPLLSVSSPLKPNIECEAGLTAGSAASATSCNIMAINWGGFTSLSESFGTWGIIRHMPIAML